MSAITDGAPVFLQTGFRTGGTWLWSRFRHNRRSLCFCEPLNEELQQITPAIIARLTPENAKLRHPTSGRPYFEEYLPLLNDSGTGVKGYRIEFGLESYFATPEEQPSGTIEYLQNLLDFAASEGRQPVLKFTRALGRAVWLKSHFPQARHIALLRNPWWQFQSALSLARNESNYTFLMIPLFAISRAPDGALKELCRVLKIPYVPMARGIGTVADTYTQLAREMAVSDLFSASLGMFIASHAQCIHSADLVINHDTLAASQPYRQHVEATIETLTGLHVELSGCTQPPSPLAYVERDFDVRAASEIVFEKLCGRYAESVEFTRRQLV